jgi:hypothetical protein
VFHGSIPPSVLQTVSVSGLVAVDEVPRLEVNLKFNSRLDTCEAKTQTSEKRKAIKTNNNKNLYFNKTLFPVLLPGARVSVDMCVHRKA